MKWIRKDVEAYYDIFVCSECGDEILVTENGLMPCYCKNCESEVDE